jgi:Tol biopolymer transport system component
MSTSPRRTRARLSVRILITLVLIALLILVLVFLLSQPVSAPGQTDATAESAADAAPPNYEFVFTSDRDGDYDVYAASGGALINLTNNEGSADGFASYSVDGVQISYVSSQGADELGGFLMNADGTNQVPAQADIGTMMNIFLSGRGDWDRRGTAQTATIISLRDLNLEVYYAAGETQTNLTQNSAIDWYAHLSPDGTQIAFASDRVDEQHDIYVIDVTGENLRRLTDHPANDWSPVWTDDGRILFASERDGRFDGDTLNLYVIDVATDDSIPSAQRVDGGMTIRAGMIPNADNTHVLEMSNETGDWEIYITTLADGSRVNISSHPAHDVFPVWK